MLCAMGEESRQPCVTGPLCSNVPLVAHRSYPGASSSIHLEKTRKGCASSSHCPNSFLIVLHGCWVWPTGIKMAVSCLQGPHTMLLTFGGKRNISGKDFPPQHRSVAMLCIGAMLSQQMDLYDFQTPSLLVHSLRKQMQHH